MKIDGSYRGLVTAFAMGLLAVGVASAMAWSRASAAPEHGHRLGTGIICATSAGDCVIPEQLVGAGCSCPANAPQGERGVVLPTPAARGG